MTWCLLQGKTRPPQRQILSRTALPRWTIKNYHHGMAVFGLTATKSGSHNQQKIFLLMGVPIIFRAEQPAFQGKGLDEKCCWTCYARNETCGLRAIKLL